MLANKNMKFLFHHFNDFLNSWGLPFQRVRHTIITQDGKGLVELHKQNQPYFFEKSIEIREDLPEVKFDENENEIVKDITADNFYDLVSILSF